MARLAAHLAVRELRHDWLASLCFIASLVGVMAPLLVVLSLKNGVVGSMISRLVEDPSNRELIAIGAGAHDAEFFDWLAERADVAFVVPATRSINGLADAVRNPDARRLERAVTILPSAAGDPLLTGPPVTRGEAQISARLAEALDVKAGDSVEMIIGREIDGQSETARADLAVIGVAPEERFGPSAVFLSLDDLLAVEAFRDDPDVSAETWREPRPAPERYASFRLYAAELGDLQPLARALEDRGVRVRPRAENAALLLAFRRNLDILYAVIAILAVVGFWAAMAANLRGMVERQRVAFSLLRLVGLSDGARRLIPLFQSLLLVVSGTVLTLVLVLPSVWAINRWFGTASGEFVAWLGPQDIAATLLVGALTAVTASFWAVRAVDDIQSDEVLRHA